MKVPIPIVIADADPQSAATLGKQLETQAGIRIVGYARRAPEAVALVGELSPSVLVLDVTSMRDEAITVLEILSDARRPVRPAAMVLTAFGHERLTQRCVDLGAGYYMLKPCPAGVMAARIKHLAGAGSGAGAAAVADREDWAAEVAAVLRSIGIPSHVKGYLYLREAVVTVVQQPQLLDAVTKELYPLIAQANGATAARVERSIRHAIDMGWRQGPPAVAAQLFGDGTGASRTRPTNSALIGALARLLMSKR